MKVLVHTRSGREVAAVTNLRAASATVDDLCSAIHARRRALPPNRQRLTLPAAATAAPAATASGARETKHAAVVLKPGTPLADYGLTDNGDVVDGGEEAVYLVHCKDLGPQIGWRTVFVAEYLGPLLVFPLLYVLRYGGGGGGAAAHPYQRAATVAWMVHYAKRELETLFVHRFSNATMPLSNLFKNCAYYWGFAAVVAHFVTHQLYTPVSSPLQFRLGMGAFYLCELGNLVAHVMLRNLRPPGTRVRAIPRGFAFEYVSCPNYTFEVAAWLGFNLATQTVAGYAFMAVGAAQMVAWARGKHRNYRREFGARYPRSRKVIVPFVY